ncbi:amine oxidase catalytic domain-containing protein [Aspergillus fijiensis CBS 313.89]|uniref:Amine oxidase n=1 Tax=Aspergillus fijiensis CBS 313.89 TaxID=1448319 RepID=A0A8G1RXY4_9EURO|nr:amine oxidase catalytic domain-containing protein [Aspergillus fijiensis CBS 313.89]RAK81605.1 amine oxidase catalytic domain-containing protein [Aspergillus fijiensis CBS 313.89]
MPSPLPLYKVWHIESDNRRASVVNDPWLYGTDSPDVTRCLYQCYMYAVLNDDPEANHYSLPMAFAPIFDAHTAELVEIERLPRGAGAELDQETVPWDAVEPVEYGERLLGKPYFRQDLKPLHTVREGPVLHNVFYDGRLLFHRVSMSEMTAPYGDPRAPYRRKQAFDLGDTGFGLTSNTLALGCDCLGQIAYFDGIRTTGTGEPVEMKNVICMHEVDEGIGWKHTNMRNRTLVIQCTATVMNYEYILAFVLDQAANLHVEVKATGIMSTMPIARHTSSPWGTVVAPGVLAVNHQHLLNLRIDPALDGTGNTVVYNDVLPVRDDPTLDDPQGCAFRRTTTAISQPGGYELNLAASRTYRIINPNRTNAISGEPVGYRLHASPSQMLIMGPETFNSRRGRFTTKPIWDTDYRDEELYAAGEFTN